MIRFLHPEPSAPTGGNVYNHHVVECVLKNGFPLVPVIVAADVSNTGIAGQLCAAPGDSVLWDSLLIDRLPETAAMMHDTQHALLVHYLTSENPQLDREERHRILGWEERAANAVNAFIATGQRIAEVLKQRYPDKPVFVAEPGVDPMFLQTTDSIYQRSDQGVVHLLTVANLLPAKGHLEVLAILSRLVALNWCWHIVGDDQAETAHVTRIHQVVVSGGLSERIVFHGILPQTGLAKLLRKMDVFLFASHYEAYGMALAESVASGLPVVSTRVGEAERLVRHGVNGLLSGVGDWHSFQRNLEKLVCNGVLRAQMRGSVSRLPIRTWKEASEDFIRACQAAQDW